MTLEIRLKKGESFTIDAEYIVRAKRIQNGITTLVIESLGDSKPVITIHKTKDNNEDSGGTNNADIRNRRK